MAERDFSDVSVVGLDLDQTLYPKSANIDEAIQSHIYKVVAERLGIGLDAAERNFKELYKYGKGLSGGASLRQLGLKDGSDVVQAALEQADISVFLRPDQEVQELLAEWAEAFRGLDLITGSNRRMTYEKLGSLAIPPELFASIITSDDASKSDGTAFERWLSMYPELSPANFVYLGDRASTDHVVPSRYGIRTILVNIVEVDDSFDCVQLPSLIEAKGLLRRA